MRCEKLSLKCTPSLAATGIKESISADCLNKKAQLAETNCIAYYATKVDLVALQSDLGLTNWATQLGLKTQLREDTGAPKNNFQPDFLGGCLGRDKSPIVQMFGSGSVAKFSVGSVTNGSNEA